MILFINCFITDKAITIYDRGLLPSSTPLDVFKYSLASLSVLKWTKAIIYCEFDEDYKARSKELEEFARSLFPNLSFYPHRNLKQSEWQQALQEVFDVPNDDLVWFSCNHDHIFIDSDTSFMERHEQQLNDLCREHKYLNCIPTHWPEYLGCYSEQPKVFAETQDYLAIEGALGIAIQINNKNILRYWFFENDYGDKEIRRTDGIINTPLSCGVVPFKELVRHFDGYSHAHIDIDICPPLFIPAGFFENDIKIDYCTAERTPGHVLVDPRAKHFSVRESSGADMICLLEDLPAFWRSRISSINDASQGLDRRELIRKRNEAVLRLTAQCNYFPPKRIQTALYFDPEQDRQAELAALQEFTDDYLRNTVVKAYYEWLALEYRSMASSKLKIDVLSAEVELLKNQIQTTAEKYVQLMTDVSDMANRYAEEYVSGGDLSRAERILLESAKLASDVPNPHLNLVNFYARHNRFQEALSAMKPLMGFVDNNPAIRARLERLGMKMVDSGA